MSCDTNTSPERFLTEEEVAKLLRIARSNLRAIRARQEIPFYRIGFGRGRVVYAQDELQRWIESRRCPAAEAA